MKAFLGINSKGKVEMYVSPFALNPLGTRCEKGPAFPDSVREFSNPLDSLRDLQEYFDQLEKKKKK